MSIRDTRQFEVIDENSRQAEALCLNVFQPAADYLAGESFQDSEFERVGRESTYHYEEERTAFVGFTAFKTSVSSSGLWEVNYHLAYTLQRPRVEGEYWPEASEQDSDEEEALVVFSGAGDTYDCAEDGDEDEDEDDDSEDFCFVEETTVYTIDTQRLKPIKLITWAYYDAPGREALEEEPSNFSPVTPFVMLDEQPDTEVALQKHDLQLSHVFSEHDLSDILGHLARLGYDPGGSQPTVFNWLEIEGEDELYEDDIDA